jgi:uncharacterized protein (DUF697 family)
MATRSLAQAERDARSTVNKWVAGAAVISFVPGSSLVLGAADVKMVNDVAKALEVVHFNVEEVITAIGATIAGRVASDGLLSFVPIVGWAIKSAVAAGVTKAAGEIVIEYFKSRSSLV